MPGATPPPANPAALAADAAFSGMDTDMYTAGEARYRALRSAIPNSLVALFGHDLRLLATTVEDPSIAPLFTGSPFVDPASGHTPISDNDRTDGDAGGLRLSPAALLSHLAPQAQQALSGTPASITVTVRRENAAAIGADTGAGVAARARHGHGNGNGAHVPEPSELVRTFRASAVPVHDAEGQVVAGLLLAQDTTEQEHMSRQLRDVVEGVGAFVWEYDRDRQRHTFVSDGAVDLLGYPMQDWLTDVNFWELVLHPADISRVVERASRLVPGERVTLDHRLIAADGNVHWMRSTIVLAGEDDRRVIWRGMTVDVTDRQSIEHALQAAEERYRTLVEQLPGVVYRMERDPERARAQVQEHTPTHAQTEASSPFRPWSPLRLRYVSPQIANLTGVNDDAWTVSTWERHLLPADRDRVLEQVQEAVRQQHPWTLEYRMLTRDGRTIWVRDEANLVREDDGLGAVFSGGGLRERGERNESSQYWQGLLTNITERKELEAQLAHRAYHDVVTGLPNRALLLDNLQRALAAAQRRNRHLAVLFLDLDNFKSINDVFGHAAGDNLLTDVARRLETCVRGEDTAARIGGDEFAILLPVVDGPEVAIDVARRILEMLAIPLTVHAHDQAAIVTASIGIALGGQSGDTPDDLLRRADMAMYRAKAAGKNRYDLFDSTIHAAAVERTEMEVDLRRALEQRELTMHYQPFVSLPDHRIVGVEALVRWQHPRRGLLPAAEFLPAAEESGLIIPLGQWALREACRQVASWRGQDATGKPALMVGVNLSTPEFHDANLLPLIAEVLQETGLPPGALILEITEATLMADTERAVATLQQLALLGVRAAIDDFGLTYASMARLSRFPLAYLQIGRRFVDNLSTDLDATVMVSGMIGLAHALRLEAIAEGVESAGPAGRLVELYCDMAQGHYYAHPLPASEMHALLLRSPDPAAQSASPTAGDTDPAGLIPQRSAAGVANARERAEASARASTTAAASARSAPPAHTGESDSDRRHSADTGSDLGTDADTDADAAPAPAPAPAAIPITATIADPHHAPRTTHHAPRAACNTPHIPA